jgi:hypothetical protein
MRRTISCLTLALIVGCAGTQQKGTGTGAPRTWARSAAAYRTAATPAIEALRAGKFDAARERSHALVRDDPDNPYARLVKAITDYKRMMHDLAGSMRIIVVGVAGSAMLNRFLGDRSGAIGGLDAANRLARAELEAAEKRLIAVQADLEAASHPELTMELCLACWEVDWTGTGQISRLDRHLLEIELDARGEPLPEKDPRRRPTFRFDHGDVLWARAFLSFQRALFDLLLAYQWTEASSVLSALAREEARVVIRLVEPARVAALRRHLLQGLELADRAREAYLAEKDDDREWLPSPRQRNHPLPLPVDRALYETWAGVVDDLRRLVRGEEGLSVAAVAQLGDHKWEVPPRGYLHIGRLLDRPRDIVLDLKHARKAGVLGPSLASQLREAQRAMASSQPAEQPEKPKETVDMERVLKAVLGDCYVEQMKPTRLIGRLERMKREMSSGKESMQRKLRYLMWLN